MRRIIIIIISVSGMFYIMSSCEGIDDFLEKPPGIDVTEETIFSSRQEVETAVASMYLYGIHSVYGYAGNSLSNPHETLSAGATDEAETAADWYSTNWWNEASINPNKIDDPRYSNRWQAIRKANILIERINSVPDADQAYQDQVKGEALFIRALNYFEMFKRFGGVPIIETRLNVADNLMFPRNTVEEVVNFIVRDCDDAAALLPSSYPSNFRGRATKGAALILKSKALLFAASPQFNTTTSYLDAGENKTLVCYGNVDIQRWQLAADAAKAVIDWAPTADCHLITDQGVTKNYKYVWEQYDNAEIILAEKSSSYIGKWTRPWSAIAPPTVYPGSSGQNGISVTFNFVKFYERKDGTKQTWNPSGGNDLNQKYAELDPRFVQTVAYNGSFWNEEHPNIQIFEGGRHQITCDGGHWLHKLYPDAISEKTWQYIPNSTLFRLAEAYLNYAEALNEAQGPVQDAYDAVDMIRERSGMPPFPAGLSKEQFRERVRNERAIELAFEDHRFWDIRRWLIAENEGVMKGDMYGLRIFKIENSPEFRYEPYVFEIRSFVPRMYLHPFPQNEVNKGYLVQNPGW